MSVYGHRCLGPKGRAEGCLGRMRYEMSEKEMYNQLLYLRGLWDVDSKSANSGAVKGEAVVKTEGEAAVGKELVKALAEHNRGRFGTCRGVVQGYLDKCGRVWVQMDGLFGFAMDA